MAIWLLAQDTTDGEAVANLQARLKGMAFWTRNPASDFPIWNIRKFCSIGCNGNQSSVLNCCHAMKITLTGGTLGVSHAMRVGTWKWSSVLWGCAGDKRVQIAHGDGHHVRRVSKVEINLERTNMATARAL